MFSFQLISALTDKEQYAILTAGDAQEHVDSAGDYRIVISSGLVDYLPGDTVVCRFALIEAEGMNSFMQELTDLERWDYPHELNKGNTERVMKGKEQEPLLKEFILGPAHPNPFNSYTKMTLELPKERPVRMEVFSVLGEKVNEQDLGVLSVGRHSILFSATGDIYASGIYLVRVTAGDVSFLQKVVLLK